MGLMEVRTVATTLVREVRAIGLVSKLPLRPAQVLVERPAGRLGLFWRCQGAQNGRSKPPVCLKRRFRLLKHCYT